MINRFLFSTWWVLTFAACAKGRLFTTTPAVPPPVSQFHLLNSFALDSALAFNLNSAVRENVTYTSFSQWYPFDSTAKTKQIGVYNPSQTALHRATSIVTFKTNTIYLLYLTYNASDGLNPLIKSVAYDIRPTLHGFSRFRFLTAFNGVSGASLYAEALGTGRNLHNDGTTASASNTSGSGPIVLVTQGNREVTLKLGNRYYSYGKTPFEDSKAYFFIGIGAGTTKSPFRLLRTEEGKPETLISLEPQEVYSTLNADSLASIRFVHGCFTFTEIRAGTPQGSYTDNLLGVSAFVNGIRRAQDLYFLEQTYNSTLPSTQRDLNPFSISKNRFVDTTVSAGAKTIVFTQGDAINAAVSNTFNANLEKGKAYTFMTVPKDARTTGLSAVDVASWPQERIPFKDKFRLRIVNMLAGSLSVLVERATGELILPPTRYKQASEYAEFDGASGGQPLRLVVLDKNGAPVSTFDNVLKTLSFSLNFTSTTSGTLFLMGSIDALENGKVAPTLDYRADAPRTNGIPALLY